MYKILVKKSVEKQLTKIPKKDLTRIDKIILSLTSNPFPQQIKQLHTKPKTFRIRQGDYRILYTVDDLRKEVTIFAIKHRKEVYREL
ncbi:MAG TPA: type II toxin-antitoxin system RelE/ParE family toxin [Nitrospiria bacterium]|jgi:mRNA interferase RelE/StbE